MVQQQHPPAWGFDPCLAIAFPGTEGSNVQVSCAAVSCPSQRAVGVSQTAARARPASGRAPRKQ
eukprot:9724837-Alexandrium_andersonii.AAC.1